jgi:hypothetical protein
MRGTSSYGIGFSSSVRASRAGAVDAARFPQTSLSLGLSVFHARLAQRSTRDLACLS